MKKLILEFSRYMNGLVRVQKDGYFLFKHPTVTDRWFTEAELLEDFLDKKGQGSINDVRAWDFVEEFYPKYYSSDDIAENDDLQKIVDGEINGCAEEVFRDIAGELGLGILHESVEDMDESEIEEVKVEAQKRLDSSNAGIYERSIEEYLNLLK